MVSALILGSLILIICIAGSQFINRLGIPALIAFLLLGLLMGSVGPWGLLSFTNYDFVEHICSVALVFIIFYGGFGTNWKTARPAIVEGVLYSTVGVLITAGLVMLFAKLVFGLGWAESFLIGSVVSCIDAASIFSILRTKKLSLKYNTASVLEIEGGCNDLPAYMLTIVAIIILKGQSAGGVFLTVVLQLVVGVAVGVLIALATVFILKRVGQRLLEGMNLVLVIAVAVLSYALSEQFGGNGYLSAYLCGIILGNAQIPKRSHIVNLFDTIDWLAQIVIFFLLGLMATPANLPAMIVPGALLMVFLLVVARPLATFLCFKPFGAPLRKIAFISWAGIRGAASIVFVFLALASGVLLESDLFSMIFIVALLSIVIQGTLFPTVAKKLDIIDAEGDYLLSFNDFQAGSEAAFMKMRVHPEHEWVGRALRDLEIGQESLIVLIKRGGQTIVPNGTTVIEPGDILVMTGASYLEDDDANIEQLVVDEDDPWAGLLISELNLPDNTLVVSVEKSDGSLVTPRGFTRIHPGDTVTTITWD
ncbi:MAG: potassium/proton antiporter [Coriobacteriales bacterium]|jgi:cell volume regulation protein A|nr:potassium/proton antiporter [Coriobacteriales bacterium]